ncbi:hypothetical protein CHELA20_50434 [Hyphomicrobiales bacterium]|nr:hypothetical protein CHELA20_50434 [Hyphomicrobiales bacterium]CAH1679524.1 hypothetical protein CHELA41_24692 [Hyphomicrobiales bacterium]
MGHSSGEKARLTAVAPDRGVAPGSRIGGAPLWARQLLFPRLDRRAFIPALRNGRG